MPGQGRQEQEGYTYWVWIRSDEVELQSNWVALVRMTVYYMLIAAIRSDRGTHI